MEPEGERIVGATLLLPMATIAPFMGRALSASSEQGGSLSEGLYGVWLIGGALGALVGLRLIARSLSRARRSV